MQGLNVGVGWGKWRQGLEGGIGGKGWRVD